MIYPVPFIFNNEDEIIRFSDEASKQKFELSVSADDIVVNAKSVLALFNLLHRPVYLVAGDCTNPNSFYKFIKKIEL